MSGKRQDLDPLIGWLGGPGRQIADGRAFHKAFAGGLDDAGYTVDRISTGVPLLHPQLYSTSLLWQRGIDEVEERRVILNEQSLEIFRKSPMMLVHEQGRSVRRRIGGTAEPGEFSIIPDLLAAGTGIDPGAFALKGFDVPQPVFRPAAPVTGR